MDSESINKVSGQVVSAAIRVHSTIGPGLLESMYQRCLVHELTKRGMRTECEVPIRVTYDGVPMGLGYYADVIVQGAVIVELKTVLKLLPVHQAQLLSYLRASGLRAGLLINFHEAHLRDGIKRVVNNL